MGSRTRCATWSSLTGNPLTSAGTKLWMRQTLSILSSFPSKWQPRPSQVQVLQQVEKAWASTDVFVIGAPVGAGKSPVAEAICGWASKQHKLRSLILTPNNLLRDQYLRANPKLVTLKAKREYVCQEMSGPGREVSCETRAAEFGGCCKSGCGYTAANRRIRVAPWAVVNSWTYLSHKLYPDVLVVDEAHALLPLLRDLQAKRLWHRDYQFPSRLESYSDLMKWVEQERAERPAGQPDPKLELLWADLRSGAHKYLVERAVEPYRGRMQPCLKLLPIDTSTAPPVLWPSRVKKLVLMSATFGPADLEQLGLDARRVTWLESESPIPAVRRPVMLSKPGFDLSHTAGEAELRAAAAEIGQICSRHPGESGLIHMTYEMMPKLLPLLPEELRKRLMAHTRDNKRQVYEAFLKAPAGTVLACAGMWEGVDLPGDLARFQILSKVPWPSLEEPAWKWLAEADEMRYKWEALRTVMQGCGRVCRGPEDFGRTYVLDRSFSRLPVELMPTWFRESLAAGAAGEVK